MFGKLFKKLTRKGAKEGSLGEERDKIPSAHPPLPGADFPGTDSDARVSLDLPGQSQTRDDQSLQRDGQSQTRDGWEPADSSGAGSPEAGRQAQDVGTHEQTAGQQSPRSGQQEADSRPAEMRGTGSVSRRAALRAGARASGDVAGTITGEEAERQAEMTEAVRRAYREFERARNDPKSVAGMAASHYGAYLMARQRALHAIMPTYAQSKVADMTRAMKEYVAWQDPMFAPAGYVETDTAYNNALGSFGDTVIYLRDGASTHEAEWMLAVVDGFAREGCPMAKAIRSGAYDEGMWQQAAARAQAQPHVATHCGVDIGGIWHAFPFALPADLDREEKADLRRPMAPDDLEPEAKHYADTWYGRWLVVRSGHIPVLGTLDSGDVNKAAEALSHWGEMFVQANARLAAFGDYKGGKTLELTSIELNRILGDFIEITRRYVQARLNGQASDHFVDDVADCLLSSQITMNRAIRSFYADPSGGPATVAAEVDSWTDRTEAAMTSVGAEEESARAATGADSTRTATGADSTRTATGADSTSAVKEAALTAPNEVVNRVDPLAPEIEPGEKTSLHGRAVETEPGIADDIVF